MEVGDGPITFSQVPPSTHFYNTCLPGKSQSGDYFVEVKKRGVCKARIHTRDKVLIKPTFIHEIEDGHTHGSDPARIVMIKGYNYVKQRSINSLELYYPLELNKCPHQV